MTGMELVLIVFLPFLGSLCAAFLPANARNAEAWLAGAVALAATVITISLYPQVAADGVLRLNLPWAPALGLDISLRMDGFAWLFALLVTGMGTLVVIYARYYMSPADPVPRFFSFFLAFMGAMLGVVLSGHLIQMVMFWEMTSLSSFMLIAYWHHRGEARRGARMALIVTGMGGLALFGGVMLLGHIAGGYDLDTVLAAGPAIQAHPWYPAVLALVCLGALTKSAQFPFHFWLPHAMSAPTPVSAYLHSATMVKAGVFLLARLWPVLAGTDAWFWIVGGAGLCSLVLAGYLALFQQDMKGVLAYSTISHLGLITLLLGMNSELALVAAVFHIANHATFKASLFMAAGIVDHETGTRDLGRLSGLARAMPLTAALAVVAAAAMAGVPLLNGFLSKEMFFAETVFLDRPGWQQIALPLAATLAGVFSVAYSLRLIHRVFFGPAARDLPHTPHEPTRWMLLPSALLVAACVLVGIFPEQVVGPYLRTATTAILGADAPAYSLAVWHGLNTPLLMSFVALGGGVLLYRAFLAQRRATTVPLLEAIDGRHLFDAVLTALTGGAAFAQRRLSSERLQMQMLLIFAVALGGALLLVKPFAIGWGANPPQSLDPAFALLWLVGGACALAVAWHAKYHRFAAIAFAGGAGLATSLTFVWFSAPDLALTQLTVEVVTTVLILLGLRWLPRRNEAIAARGGASPHLRRMRDILLASASGLGLAALTYTVLTRPAVDGIAPFFIQNALPQGGGLNVVNVILVDFRGFDTFGEITVLGIVALTVYALLRRFRPAPESIPLPRQQDDDVPARDNPADALLPAGTMMLPAVLVRLLLPLAMLASLFFLLRGHNAPGGGFVGGLILATAVILQYLVGGVHWVESRLRIHPLYWIATGLLCAAAAGIGAAFAGVPFLTSQAWHGMLPLLGELHLSSVLLFDLGVYMLVVGATTLMLVAIAHQSLRSHGKH
ncbi:monovalent cation/H+ antiporter subunit A [Rhodocyclaceae bacterium]